MADEEGGEGVESEEGEEVGKKKSKKKLIIMVVLMLAIGYEAASMTILKPPPLTAAQKKAKADKAKFELETKCAIANGMKPPEPPAATDNKGKKSKKTETTEPPEPEVGLPVLVLDSVTINLNGSGNHYLKLGLGLQMPKGTVLETVKLENPGTAALNYVISELRKKTLNELAQGDLEPLQHELGYKVCTDPALNYDGQITSIYFTDFVTQ